MKATEMLKKWPMQFLVWDVNEDTNVFFAELSVLEENGEGRLMDPWCQRLNLKSAKPVFNQSNDTVVGYRLFSEFQGYPIELSIINE